MSEARIYSLDEIKEVLALRGLPTDIEEIHDLDTFVEGFQLFQANRCLEAIELFSTMLNSERHGLVRTYLGACYYRLGNHEAASRHFLYLANHAEGRVQIVASSMLANLQIQQGDYDVAIAHLLQLPPHPYNLLDLAICYTKKGRRENQPEMIKQAREILATVSLDTLEQRGVYNYYFLKALHAHFAGELEEAQQYFKKALHLVQQVQDKANLLNNYALLQIDRERYEEAATMILTGREFAQTPLEAEDIFVARLHAKGVQLFTGQKFFEAVEILMMVLQIQDHELSRKYLAKAYCELGRYESGHKHFSHLAESLDPSIREYAISSLAAIEIYWGYHDKAIQRLLTLPENTWNLINLCVLYWRKYESEHNPAFIHQIKTALSKIERDSLQQNFLQTVYHLRALIHQAEKDYPAAEELFQKSLALIVNENRRQQGLQDFIAFYLEAGRYKEAIALLSDVTSSDEKNRLEDALVAQMLEKGLALYNGEAYQEAIEYFLLILAVQGHNSVRQHLALCYFHLEQYDLTYRHFSYLAQHAEGKTRDYAVSMQAGIDILWGNYTKAIKTLKSLPATVGNQLNLCILYWKKYKEEKDELAIRDALKILNKLDVEELEAGYVQNVNHLKALVYQAQKIYTLAEDHYRRALDLAVDDLARGRVLNDHASLLIELKKYAEAESMLDTARKLVEGQSDIEEATTHKWLGIIAMQKDEYETAKVYLEKAAQVIKEKGLLEEIAVVNFLLSKTYRKSDFYKAADYYADGVVFERLAENLKTHDEKMFTLFLNQVDEGKNKHH